MTELMEIEQNLSVIVQCPNCTMGYEVQDGDGNRQDYPKLCKRCGCPMNYEEAQGFADAQAEEQSKPSRPTASKKNKKRNIVTAGVDKPQRDKMVRPKDKTKSQSGE